MSMLARARARAIARAFASRATSSSTASVSTTARVWTSELSSAHHRSFAELHATTRAFAASASPRVFASAYASNDGDDGALDDDAAAVAATSRAPKPTKHKNHIKRMAQRDAARRENARKHKEGKHARAVEREEKRLERWRSAVELRDEYARRNASGGGE